MTGITSLAEELPTLIVFSGGRPAKRINDVHGRQQLLRELQESLASGAYDRMAVQNDF